VTLREALGEGVERLERHGVASPRLSSEVLLAHCLSVDKVYLFTHDDRELTEDEHRRFEEAIYDRLSGVPVQYIVGRQEFYGRYFTVNPAVLIPRPETEAIIETVLKLNSQTAPEIIDVGTGSGCIAVTTSLEIPSARVFATDISMEALRVARQNARQLGATVEFACVDLLEGIGGTFDFVLSNPPYVSPSETLHLQREVREHEPHVALFASNDGVAMFRRLVPAAEGRLRPGGWLIMEIGVAMDERVLALFGDRWETVYFRPDLQGIPRTVIARLRGARD
jgi:release factor glutamine methyltransferase